jgi:hypothetical protein
LGHDLCDAKKEQRRKLTRNGYVETFYDKRTGNLVHKGRLRFAASLSFHGLQAGKAGGNPEFPNRGLVAIQKGRDFEMDG